MTSPREPLPDDRSLQELFDRTASPPTGAQLTKLAARAAEVPERARSRAWWPAWVLGPTLVAASALVVFVAWPVPTPEVPGTVAPIGSVARAPEAPTPAPDEVLASSSDPTLYDDLLPTATAMFSVESDEFDALGGSLEVPSDDEDLDAWLAAADDILGGG